MDDEKLIKHFLKQTKRLPRDRGKKIKRVFVANGQRYVIWDWQNGIPINRYHAYKMTGTMLEFNFYPKEMRDKLKESKDIIDNVVRGDKKKSIIDAWSILANMIEGVDIDTAQKFPKALLHCTLFILREGEDIKEWDNSLAVDKINDWAKEGFAINDFFLLAQSSLRELRGSLDESMESGSTLSKKKVKK